MELREREREINRRERRDKHTIYVLCIILTSTHCGSRDCVLFTPSSSSDSGSDSDGVLSSLLQTSQCVHSLATRNTRDHGCRDRVTVSVNVGVIIITQTAAIALEPLTTHPDEWAEPSHK